MSQSIFNSICVFIAYWIGVYVGKHTTRRKIDQIKNEIEVLKKLLKLYE